MSKTNKVFSLTDMQDCWNAAREFNSDDGVVDINIVYNFGMTEDLEPRYADFEDYFIEKNKLKLGICHTKER